MENTILTPDILMGMTQDIIAFGEVENSPLGLFMTDSDIGRKLLWVAKRGSAHDWAIYTYWAEYGIQYVINNGEKVTYKSNIKKLVPCTDAALNLYRF